MNEGAFYLAFWVIRILLLVGGFLLFSFLTEHLKNIGMLILFIVLGAIVAAVDPSYGVVFSAVYVLGWIFGSMSGSPSV